MLKPFRGMINRFAGLVHRYSAEIDKMSRRRRWLLGALIIVIVAAICVLIFRLSGTMEGFKEWGILGAFLVSFVSSMSIVFPVPGFFVVAAIVTSDTSHWAVIAVASTADGALGQFTSYLAGCGGRLVIDRKRSAWYGRAEDWMKRYGSMTIFAFALLFLPVDVAGIIAGALRFPYWKYLLAVFAGYLPKTLIGCYIVHRGAQIWPSVQQFLGEGLTWWGWLLVIAGVALIAAGGMLIWRERRRNNKNKQVQG